MVHNFQDTGKGHPINEESRIGIGIRVLGSEALRERCQTTHTVSSSIISQPALPSEFE